MYNYGENIPHMITVLYLYIKVFNVLGVLLRKLIVMYAYNRLGLNVTYRPIKLRCRMYYYGENNPHLITVSYLYIKVFNVFSALL